MAKRVSSQKRKTNDNKKGKLSTPVIVAIIGFSATTLAALLNGYFGFRNTREGIDRPILLTQTAFASSIGNSIPTSTPFQPGTNVPPSPTAIFDWKTIVSIADVSDCPNFAFPDYLFLGSDAVSWLQENGQSYYSRSNEVGLMYVPRTGEVTLETNLLIFLSIRNISDEMDWIKLANQVNVSVDFIGEPSELAHVLELYACGGGGYEREFSEVPLRSDFKKYNVDAKSTEFDYYTLEKGGFEIYRMNFNCQSPGIYHVRFDIPVTYRDMSDTASYSDELNIVCPQKVIYYYSAPSDTSIIEVYFVKKFEWTGTEYKETN